MRQPLPSPELCKDLEEYGRSHQNPVNRAIHFAGIPVLMALRVTKGTLGNKAMEGVIDEVIEKVAAGKTIAEVMDRTTHFPGAETAGATALSAMPR